MSKSLDKPSMARPDKPKPSGIKNPSKLSVSISVKDTEAFQVLMNYTQTVIEILSEYPLSKEDEKKLNSVSKDFFSFKREVEV